MSLCEKTTKENLCIMNRMALAIRWRAKFVWDYARATVLGWRNFCPVCSSRVQAFKPLDAYYVDTAKRHGWPYGVDSSETCNVNAYTCPECGASDRDRLMALYIADYMSSAARSGLRKISILDFAPQKSLSKFIVRSMRRHEVPGIYRTADLLRTDVDLQMDICDMRAVESESVDLFICSHVLEHVVDDGKALKELFRVLAPGGAGVLMVPISLCINDIDEDPTVIDEAERWRRFGQNDHVRLYSKKGFIGRVREAGFRLSEKGVGGFGSRQFARNGLTEKSILYIVHK